MKFRQFIRSELRFHAFYADNELLLYICKTRNILLVLSLPVGCSARGGSVIRSDVVFGKMAGRNRMLRFLT